MLRSEMWGAMLNNNMGVKLGSESIVMVQQACGMGILGSEHTARARNRLHVVSRATVPQRLRLSSI